MGLSIPKIQLLFLKLQLEMTLKMEYLNQKWILLLFQGSQEELLQEL